MRQDPTALREKERRGGPLAAVGLVLLSLLALLPVLLFIPARVAAEIHPAPEVRERFFQETNDLLEQNLEGYSYIRKHYRIRQGALPAAPLASAYSPAAWFAAKMTLPLLGRMKMFSACTWFSAFSRSFIEIL